MAKPKSKAKSKTKAGKKRQPTKVAKKSPRKPRRWPGWLGRAAVLGTALLVMGVIYCDALIQKQFEGNRWVIPARVYARPLELVEGKRLQPADLQQEMALLGYRNSVKSYRPGDFERYGNVFIIYLREFDFWDEQQAATEVSFELRNGLIKGLKNHATGELLQKVRFDPLQIGRMLPTHQEDRNLVGLDEVPQTLVDALLATEDRAFYEHYGVSLRGISRALWTNVSSGRVAQGGSTLTQQLVKNYFLTNERSLWRKIREAVMAILLEVHYDKDEILQAYLNEVFLGQDRSRAIHGIGLASQFYFDKKVSELTTSQMALLVGMIKGPSLYEPRRNPENAKSRRNTVLEIMHQQGLISAEELAYNKSSGLGVVAKPSQRLSKMPGFIQLARRQLQSQYSIKELSRDGLNIFTSLDPLLQQRLEKSVAKSIVQVENTKGLQRGSLQTAAIVTSSYNGRVLGLVADRQPNFAGFNRALDAYRPVGSVIKPFVTLTALQYPERFSLATMLEDSEFTLTGANGQAWAPKNYDKTQHGLTPLHEALSQSYNLSIARLGQAVGMDKVARNLNQWGLNRRVPAYPSLALGAVEMSPFEMTTLYQTIASGGYYIKPSSILAVTDASGALLQRYPVEVEQVADYPAIYLVTQNMREAVAYGTGKYLHNSLPTIGIAGKTGTTDNLRDSWFAGFSGEHLAVVWVGRDDNKPASVTGSSGALRIFTDFLTTINTRPLRPSEPDDIEWRWIDSRTGKLAGSQCTSSVQMPFVRGYAPTEYGQCLPNAPE